MDTITKINYLMEKNGVKNRDLANHLGLTAQAVTDWRAERSKSYAKYLVQIADFFNISIEFFTGSVGTIDNELFKHIDCLCKIKNIAFFDVMIQSGISIEEIELYYLGNRGIIFSYQENIKKILEDNIDWSTIAFFENEAEEDIEDAELVKEFADLIQQLSDDELKSVFQYIEFLIQKRQ